MKNRMSKIFREDGRSFILAIDHGSSLDVLPGMKDPGAIIDAAVANGVDAIICTYGIYNHYAKHFRNVPAIIRGDGGASMLGDGKSKTLKLMDVEDIVRIGGDGVVCMGFPGAPYEEESFQSLQDFVTEGELWNVPICAEVLPVGWNNATWTKENLTFVSRVGAEYGADIIKTQYTGDKESFKTLTSSVFAPVVILGGPGTGTPEGLLSTIKDSLEAGGSGAAIGRSIWKHEDPGKYCKAISRLIHEDISVEEALKEMEA